MMPQSWLMTGSRKKGATLGSQDRYGASIEPASLTILLARSLCFVGRLCGSSSLGHFRGLVLPAG